MFWWALAYLTMFLFTMECYVRSGARGYALFKTYKETRDRQKYYGKKLVFSFGLFLGGSLIFLLLLQQLDGLWRFPIEFVPAVKFAKTQSWVPIVSPSDLVDAALPISIGVLISTLIPLFARSKKMLVLGDIQAIFPRNSKEIFWGGLLSVNAGFSEEICFRLALPLGLTYITGNAILAFAVATLIFGLMHRYQGWVGMLFTGLLGGFLSIQYLASGSLLYIIAIHIIMNVTGLVVRPIIMMLATAGISMWHTNRTARDNSAQ